MSVRNSLHRVSSTSGIHVPPSAVGTGDAAATTLASSIAQRAQAAATQYREQAVQLAQALHALCGSIGTWADWYAVYNAGKDLPPSLHGRLSEALGPIAGRHASQWVGARRFNEEVLALREVCPHMPSGQERDALVHALAPALVQEIDRMISAYGQHPNDPGVIGELLAILDTWQPLADQCPSLKHAIHKALREAVLPSGGDLRATRTHHPLNSMRDLWPRVRANLLPPLTPDTPSQPIAAGARDISHLCRTNRWFHKNLSFVLPGLALHLLQHSNWFLVDIGKGAFPQLRWTLLPPWGSFLTWTRPAEAQDPTLTPALRLFLLFTAMADSDNPSTGQCLDAMKGLWNTGFTRAEHGQALAQQLPLLLARALMGMPFPRSRQYTFDQRRALQWLLQRLENELKSSARALPVCIELRIGVKAKNLSNPSHGEPCSNLDEALRSSILQHCAVHIPAQMDPQHQGTFGIAVLLMSTQRNKHGARNRLASVDELDHALAFMRAFSRTHALQGSLRTALGLLLEMESGGSLTEHQRGLLQACQQNDAAHASGQAPAPV